MRDFETGNYYMRARYYNPDTGRFISEDPIKDGLNWYSYCGGNPVMFWDPSGLEDIYIFYYTGNNENESLEDRAYNEYNYLTKNTDFSVAIKGISTIEDFEKAWNSMDNNGKSITKVSIYMHSSYRSLITDNGSVVIDSYNENVPYIRISDLDNKEIYSIHLFSCNSAHLDHINDNIAFQFASTQNVKYVYGWDGSMDWNRGTGNPQLAFNQEYFGNQLSGKKRNAEGQIAYIKNNNNVMVKNVKTGFIYGLYNLNGGKLLYEQSEPTL